MQSREVGNPNGNHALLDLAKRMAEGNQGVDGGIGALAEQVMKMQVSTQEALKALAEENRQIKEKLALMVASEEQNRKLEKEYQTTINARFQALEQAVQKAGDTSQIVAMVQALRAEHLNHSHRYLDTSKPYTSGGCIRDKNLFLTVNRLVTSRPTSEPPSPLPPLHSQMLKTLPPQHI